MAALDQADITVVVTERWIEGTKRHSRGTLTIAGTDTYPTGGIPLGTNKTTAAQKFGMYRQLDVLDINGTNDATAATEYTYMYNPVTFALALYVSHDTAGVTTLPQDEEDAAGVPGARTVRYHAVGW